MNDDPRAALELQLREEVKRAERSATSASFGSNVLVAVEAFLTSWEALGGGTYSPSPSNDRNNRAIPCDFIRQTMCKLHKTLGRGHANLQTHILSMLRRVQSTECRALVLEFVPLAIPTDLHETSIGNIMRASGRNIKKEVLSLLKTILEDDAVLLKQVFDMLAIMKTAGVLSTKDVFQFSLEFLPKTAEKDLHIVVQALSRYAANGSDAQEAVDAIRTELALLEQTDVSDMFSVVTVFDDTLRGDSSPIIVEQYIARCEEIMEEACHENQRAGQGTTSDPTHMLSVFDWTMLLLLKEKDAFSERITPMVYESISKDYRVMIELCPNKFIQLVQEADESDSGDLSGLRERLIDSYMDLCVAIFLSVCHVGGRALSPTRFSEVREYLTRAIIAVPQAFQTRVVRRLICLFETIVKRYQKEGRLADKSSSSGESKGECGDIRACREIFSVAAALAIQDSTILVPFRSKFEGLLESDGVHSPCQDPSVVSDLCSITASLSLVTDKDQLVLLIRRLLFSHDEGTPAVQRQLRGLKLINATVEKKIFASDELALIGRMVTRVLGTSGSAVDQCVGMEAIKIIKHFHLQEGIAFDGKDILGRLLSKSRVVQYPQNGNSDSVSVNDFVRYDKVPDFLLPHDGSAKQPKFRAMVCCFDAFFALEKSIVKPNSWERSSVWLYTLLDAYLAVGRPSRWIPHAWTGAGIEFPPIPNNKSQNSQKWNRLSTRLRDSLGNLYNADDGCSDSERIEDILDELVQSCTTASERREVLQFFSKFSLTILLGLSVSAAVLNNVYDYFKKDLTGGTYEQRREPTMLIQHQLVKLYALKKHSLSMRKVFLVVSKKIRKRGRSANARGAQITRNAAEQIHEILQLFSYSHSLVDSGAVWVGLTDPEHDSFIISSLNGQLLANVSLGNLFSVLTMRLNMLSNLSCRLSAGQATETINSDSSEFRQRMAQFLRMTLFLSQSRQLLQEENSAASLLNLVDEVSREYLRLLHKVLVSISEFRGDDGNVKCDDVAFFFNLYQSLIGSKDPMNDAIQENPATYLSSVDHFKRLAMACFNHLQCCSVAVGLQLMETVTVLAMEASRSSSEVLITMIELDWEAMKLDFHGASITMMHEAPFALDVYMQRYPRVCLRTESDLSTEELCLKETISRLIPILSKTEGSHDFLTHQMCRHWSLVALLERRSALLLDHLSRFLVEFQSYLDDHDKPLEIAVPIAIAGDLAVQKARVDENNNANPTTNDRLNRNFTSSDSFPSLNSDTCTQYFDTLLKLTVASIGTFSISDEVEACRLRNSWKSSHPFTLLEQYFELCGSLVEILKDDNDIVFPESISPSVIQTMKLLLDVSMEKVERCIDWRISEPQPSLEEVEAGAYDPAAKSLLKDLIDAFCVEIIGAMEKLCAEKKSDSRLASLNRKVEKVFDGFRQISVEFDLGEVKTQYSDASDTSPVPKAKRRKMEAQNQRPHHQFDASTIEEHDRTNDDRNNEHDSEEEDGGGSSNHNSDDSSASGKFGVSGDWGQGHKPENSSEDDDSSRQLGEITITQ